MSKREQLSHDEIRKNLWCNVWVAVSNSLTCKESEVATSWADRALKEFDQRFKNETMGAQ